MEAQIDAKREIELTRRCLFCTSSQPALIGLHTHTQYIIAGKSVVIVGMEPSGGQTGIALVVANADSTEERMAIETDETVGRKEIAGTDAQMVP